MGDFRPMDADGSWAHPPETEEVPRGQLPPGPFQVTDMPARPPVPPQPSPQTERLLRGVAPADGDDE